MQRSCDFCGSGYVARSRTSRFCSSRCRVRNHRSPVAFTPADRDLEDERDPEDEREPGPLVAVLMRELEGAGRLRTVLGCQAVALAARVESASETGSSVAALSKELRTVRAAALAGAAVEANPLDELRARREAKLAGGGR